MFNKENFKEVKEKAYLLEKDESVQSLTFSAMIDGHHFLPVLLGSYNIKVKKQLDEWLNQNPPQTRLKSLIPPTKLIAQHRYIRNSNISPVTMQKSEAIYKAASHNEYKTLEKLIKKGENPYFQDNFDQTALHQAVQCGYKKCVTILLDAFPDLVTYKDQNSETASYQALLLGDDLEMVEILVSYGADIRIVNVYGATLLHRAARWEQKKLFCG